MWLSKRSSSSLPAKRELFGALDAICPTSTIFASNTSSLTITEIATATKRPERFVGLHFFNPVPVMKLVEVVRTIATDPEVYEEMVAFGAKLGKTPVRAHDSTGFIVNRLLVPYLLDAIRALEEGVGSIEDIDNSMKLGCGHPMGPLTLLDFVGLDTTYYIANIMFDEFHERRFASPPLLKRMVLAGWNGRKVGARILRLCGSAKAEGDEVLSNVCDTERILRRNGLRKFAVRKERRDCVHHVQSAEGFECAESQDGGGVAATRCWMRAAMTPCAC